MSFYCSLRHKQPHCAIYRLTHKGELSITPVSSWIWPCSCINTNFYKLEAVADETDGPAWCSGTQAVSSWETGDSLSWALTPVGDQALGDIILISLRGAPWLDGRPVERALITPCCFDLPPTDLRSALFPMLNWQQQPEERCCWESCSDLLLLTVDYRWCCRPTIPTWSLDVPVWYKEGKPVAQLHSAVMTILSFWSIQDLYL